MTVNFTNTVAEVEVGEAENGFKTEIDTATLELQKGEDKALYHLLQFHVHSPSEHTINGKHTDAEIHFVFGYESGDLPTGDERTITVLGFLFNYEDVPSNEFLNLWNVDKVQDDTMQLNLGYFKDLVEKKKVNKYYHYDGSFTTPTCDEVVNWVVFEDVIPMCKA